MTQLAQRAQYEGYLTIYSVNIVPFEQQMEQMEQMEVVFGVGDGKVFVKEIALYSLSRDKFYSDYSIPFELERFEVKVETFHLFKNDPLLTEGFSLKITHKYKVQWITYSF